MLAATPAGGARPPPAAARTPPTGGGGARSARPLAAPVRLALALLAAAVGLAALAARGGPAPLRTPAAAAAPPRPCLDALVLFHEDDRPLFVDGGALLALRRHVLGLGVAWVASASNRSFLHLLDAQTRWLPESSAPFSPASFDGRKSSRPAGWLFQQALKLWAVEHLPSACNNVFISDADTVWVRDFDVVAGPGADEGDGDVGGCNNGARFKYSVATKETGAWEGDIINPEYHHFVEWLTGLPKARADELTAISHWQLMQRDVLRALGRVVRARHGGKTIAEAMIEYGKEFQGMSEYEAYFSFAWYFYPDRMAVINLPYVMRPPATCRYADAPPFQGTGSLLAHFTCHDNYGGEDWYTNCRGREAACDPALRRGGGGRLRRHAS